MRVHIERLLERRDQAGQFLAQHVAQLRRFFDAFAFYAIAQPVEQMGGGIHAHVGRDQQRFQLFQQLVIDPGTQEQRIELATDLGTRARQPGAQPLRPRQFRRVGGRRAILRRDHVRRGRYGIAGVGRGGFVFLEETKHVGDGHWNTLRLAQGFGTEA